MEGVYKHSLMPAHHLNTTSSSCPAVLDNLQNEAPKKKGGRQRERTPPGFRTDEEMKNWQTHHFATLLPVVLLSCAFSSCGQQTFVSIGDVQLRHPAAGVEQRLSGVPGMLLPTPAKHD